MLEFRALHNIDLSQNHIISKEIPDDFAAFTNDYLKYARDNEVTRNIALLILILRSFRVFGISLNWLMKTARLLQI